MGKEGGDTTYFSTVESQKMMSKAKPHRDNPDACLELWEPTGGRGRTDRMLKNGKYLSLDCDLLPKEKVDGRI